nr:hypothetical protein [uncultured Cohaesibacter sp.]
MAGNGVKITTVDPTSVADDIFVLREGSVKQQSFANLSNQMAGSGAIAVRLSRAEIMGGYGAVYVAARADLDGVSDPKDKQGAWVLTTTEAGEKGIWSYSVADTDWVRIGDLPISMSLLTDVGGTANAITAKTLTSPEPSDIRGLLLVPLYDNDDAVTIALDDNDPVPLLGAGGGALTEGALAAGVPTVILSDGTNLRIMFPADAVERVEDALSQVLASAAAAAANANSNYVFDVVSQVEQATLPATIKGVRTRGQSSVDDNGGSNYTRKSLADIVTGGYPELSYKRSSDTYLPDGTEDATNGGYFLLSEIVVNPIMFGALRGRENAAVTTAALQAMFEYCQITGACFDLLGGSWFANDDGLSIIKPLKGSGRGIGYWHTYTAVANNGVYLPAQSQIILTGTGNKTISPHGMSSMRVSGGVIDNSASARSLWNEDEYTLLPLNGDFSCGIYIGPEAAGSELSGFRVLPDGGGDDGLDLYNDDTADENSGWAADWDFGIVCDSAADVKGDLIQSVGHYRMAGLLITSITITPSDDTPTPPYRQTWSRCEFEGWRGVAIRGSDTFQITAITSDSVSIDYADDHPFDPAVEDRVALSNHTFSQSLYTFTSVSDNGVTLTLNGLNADPTANYDVGDSIVARPYGGGTSHINFTDCHVGGMKHPSGLQCHDQALGSDAMTHPGTAIEMSGERMVEIVWDETCRIQSNEQVAIHLHNISYCQLPGLIEFNTDINGNTRGMRIITSPKYTDNTRVAHPAGSTIKPRFGNGLTNLLTNNGPSGILDLRPAVNIPAAAYPLFTGDDGLLWASDLIIPDLALYMSMNDAVGLRTPKTGVAGIFDNTYPVPLEKLVYDAVDGILRASDHLLPNADDAVDLGSLTRRWRSGYFDSLTSAEVRGDIYNLEDDTVVSFGTPRNAGLMLITHNVDAAYPNSAYSALLFFDTGQTPGANILSVGISANVNWVSTALTDGVSDGTDGNLTVSVQENLIQLKNRTGAAASFGVQFLG